MLIHGVDFTSRPSHRKPLTVATADNGVIVSLQCFAQLDLFEEWLTEATGTIGIDAPFGYPVELCQQLFPGKTWSEIAEDLSIYRPLDRIAPLASQVKEFRDARPVGNKEPKRLTDRESNSASAMKFFQPPVGRMAARLLPILLRSMHNILPVKPTESSVSVVEVYPAKWTRSHTIVGGYKDRLGLEEERRALLHRTRFEFSIGTAEFAIADEKGDLVDAIIACEQVATWIEAGRPMPSSPQVNLEGWII